MAKYWHQVKAVLVARAALGHTVRNITIPAAPGTNINGVNERATIESIGLGLRYALRKDISARLDYARILQSSPANRLTPNVPVDDQWRVHFSFVYGF